MQVKMLGVSILAGNPKVNIAIHNFFSARQGWVWTTARLYPRRVNQDFSAVLTPGFCRSASAAASRNPSEKLG